MSKNTNNTTVGILTVVLQFLTLISVIVGGLLGYHYIDRFSVQESKSNKKLLDLEQKLKEIDLKVKDVRESLHITGKRVQISEDIVQIITDIRPNFKVELDPKVLYYDEKVRLTFYLTNVGKYAILIKPAEITLSTEYLWGKDSKAGKLSPNVDYSLQQGFSLHVFPGQTINRPVDIILTSDFKKRHLYIYASFQAETDLKIIETLAGLLSDFLTKDELHRIALVSDEFSGEFKPME